MMYRSFSLLLKETPGLGFSDLMIWQYPAASAWDRLPCNGGDLVPGHHFQAAVNDGTEDGGQHLAPVQLKRQTFFQVPGTDACRVQLL